ncbi:MAG: hypothetical protein B1H08_01835 [Candidatus Omnitrophica bacterium 4484_171]|nr:MAG: hypothetical protein B1H08_01835 [Candidatus Omnitrophica bacterium 4484_171]
MLSAAGTIIRLVLAFFLGGIIGLEREKKGRSAGLRTHILVCVGSALITLVSIYIYNQYSNQASIDPARIAAGVVTGVGFLGAGAIIRSPEGSYGLTTAASVWVSAGIGMAVGCGYFSAATAATIIVFLTLYFLKKADSKLTRQ